MALMGRKIVAIRAYVAEGGGADYHDQSEEHPIAIFLLFGFGNVPCMRTDRTKELTD